jgi:hypothetical protein
MKNIDIDRHSEIEILYIAGNATSQNFTQIRKVNKDTHQKYLIANIERYNYLDSCNLNDTLLTLVLCDTSVYHLKVKDTITVNINNIQYQLK